MLDTDSLSTGAAREREFTTKLAQLSETAEAQPIIGFIEAINRHDVLGATSHLAPSCLHHGKVSNYRVEGVRVLFNTLLTVFPDLQLDIRDMRVEGRRVITRVAASGTHTGSFLGKPPTGQALVWESLDVAEVAPRSQDAPGIQDAVMGASEFDFTQLDKPPEYWEIMKRYWDMWSDPSIWKKIGFVPAIAC